MYIHLYSSDTWGIIQNPISEKDIKINTTEYNEILTKQNDGFYYF